MATLTPEAAPGAPPRLGRPFGVYVIVCLQLLHVVSVLLEAERIPYDVSGLLLPEYVGAGAPAVSYASSALLVAIAPVGLCLLQRWAWVATMLVPGGLRVGLRPAALLAGDAGLLAHGRLHAGRAVPQPGGGSAGVRLPCAASSGGPSRWRGGRSGDDRHRAARAARRTDGSGGPAGRRPGRAGEGRGRAGRARKAGRATPPAARPAWPRGVKAGHGPGPAADVRAGRPLHQGRVLLPLRRRRSTWPGRGLWSRGRRSAGCGEGGAARRADAGVLLAEYEERPGGDRASRCCFVLSAPALAFAATRLGLGASGSAGGALAPGRLARVPLPARIGGRRVRPLAAGRGAVPGGRRRRRRPYQGAAASATPPRLLRARPAGAGADVLQYLFFFAMNDWRSSFAGVNDHEADWEQIFVYLPEGRDGGPPSRPGWPTPRTTTTAMTCAGAGTTRIRARRGRIRWSSPGQAPTPATFSRAST